MSEAEEGNNGTADSEKPGDSQTGPSEFNKEGPIGSKDIAAVLDVNKEGPIGSKDIGRMFDVNGDGKMDLKDILRMLLGDKDGSIFPNWKETLVIIIAVSIFGAIAFSFLS